MGEASVGKPIADVLEEVTASGVGGKKFPILIAGEQEVTVDLAALEAQITDLACCGVGGLRCLLIILLYAFGRIHRRSVTVLL